VVVPLVADQRIESLGRELLLGIAKDRIAVSRGTPLDALTTNLRDPLGVLQTVGVRLSKFRDLIREGCTELRRSPGARAFGQNPLQPGVSSALGRARLLEGAAIDEAKVHVVHHGAFTHLTATTRAPLATTTKPVVRKAPKQTAPAPAPAPAAPVTVTVNPDGDYTVVAGDSLSKIAQELKLEGGWQALFEKNKACIANPDLIFVGQKLATK